MIKCRLAVVGSTLLGLATLIAIGCGKSNATVNPSGATQVAVQDSQNKQAETKSHDHSGWWCAEHGVPESACSQCSAKVAADFQKKGDWCTDHDRAKSQCFICDPSLKERFAAQYRAKEGKEPPAIEAEQESAAAKKS